MTVPFSVWAALEYMAIEPSTEAAWGAIRIAAQGSSLERERAPLAVAVVVDVSGSMAGEPLRHALQSCEILSGILGAADRLAVVSFSDHAQVVSGLTALDDAGRAQLRASLSAVRSAGSTNLHAGLGAAAGLLVQAPAGLRRALVVLSDGKPNRGLSSPAELAAYTRTLGVSVSTLGFGMHYDEDVLDAIATAGSGRHAYIVNPALARSDVARAALAQANVVADELTLRLEPGRGVQVVGVLPEGQLRYGAGGASLPVGDVYKDEARTFAVELRLDATALEAGRVLELAVEGRGMNGAPHEVRCVVTADVRAGAPVADVAALREVLTLRADAARLAARREADRGGTAGAAAALRQMVARIDASPGFARDGSLLAELREQLADEARSYERRGTASERAHRRKAELAYKPVSAGFARPPRRRPRVAARLVGVAGPLAGRAYSLWSENVIGRSPACDIVVADESVNRNHAQIRFVEDHFLVVDLGAANGTMVNGDVIVSARLDDGDVLTVGGAVFRFQLGESSQGSLFDTAR